MAVGFKGVGKSSIANFLVSNNKHTRHYSKGKIIFVKFSFNSLTNYSPKSFIYHLVVNISEALPTWKVPLERPEIRSSFNEQQTLNALRNLVRNIWRQGFFLVIIFDPIEKLIEHPQRKKVYEYLRHIYDHNQEIMTLVFFSNNPNVVRQIDPSHFGELTGRINAGLLWLQPATFDEYSYFVQPRSFLSKIMGNFSNKRDSFIYSATGGIAALVDHFHSNGNTEFSVDKMLSAHNVLNTISNILSSFSEVQQIFIYLVSTAQSRPIQITSADVEVLVNSGIIKLDGATVTYRVPAGMIREYMKLPKVAEFYENMGVYKGHILPLARGADSLQVRYS